MDSMELDTKDSKIKRTFTVKTQESKINNETKITEEYQYEVGEDCLVLFYKDLMIVNWRAKLIYTISEID